MSLRKRDASTIMITVSAWQNDQVKPPSLNPNYHQGPRPMERELAAFRGFGEVSIALLGRFFAETPKCLQALFLKMIFLGAKVLLFPQTPKLFSTKIFDRQYSLYLYYGLSTSTTIPYKDSYWNLFPISDVYRDSLTYRNNHHDNNICVHFVDESRLLK